MENRECMIVDYDDDLPAFAQLLEYRSMHQIYLLLATHQ